MNNETVKIHIDTGKNWVAGTTISRLLDSRFGSSLSVIAALCDAKVCVRFRGLGHFFRLVTVQALLAL